MCQITNCQIIESNYIAKYSSSPINYPLKPVGLEECLFIGCRIIERSLYLYLYQFIESKGLEKGDVRQFNNYCCGIVVSCCGIVSGCWFSVVSSFKAVLCCCEQGFQVFSPKWGQISPNWDKFVIFQIRFQWAKMYWNLIWKSVV